MFFKLENLQVTGSYKARAAFTILNHLSPEQKARGAALSSSGNFASAFAYMGRLLGIPTAVVMMEKTAPLKVEKSRRYGAEMLIRQTVAPPPPEAATVVAELGERVHELQAAHSAVAAAIARREPPPPVRGAIDVDHLDARARALAAHPPRGDRWADRGVVEILRTRALIAEITASLTRLRDLVAENGTASRQTNVSPLTPRMRQR